LGKKNNLKNKNKRSLKKINMSNKLKINGCMSLLFSF